MPREPRPENLRQRKAAAGAFALGALCFIVTGTTVAADPSSDPTRLPTPAAVIPAATFEKLRLDNGLDVILYSDKTLPLVAVNVWYHVGPVNEPKGRSGFAHLFEHLMFEGSRHVGNRFDRLLETAGATNVNGTTSWDRTNYFETAPREYLELLLWIESDRMGFMHDRITQERLDVQRDVVKNERRQSYENAPYGPSSLALLDALFPEGHPYHGAIIGSMRDLDAATLNDVRDFYDTYYRPSNATLAIGGDFDPAQAHAWIRRYFGTLPSGPQPRPPAPPATSAPQPCHLIVKEPVDIPKVAFGWVAAPAYSYEHAVLEVATVILAGGKATRLYQSLVVNQHLAISVDADVDPNALGTIVAVDALAASRISAERLEGALQQEIEGLANRPPTEAELRRAKRRLMLSYDSEFEPLNGPSGETGRAGFLQRFNQYLGDPGALTTWLETLGQVTSTEVARAAKETLDRRHRVTVVTLPDKGSESR